MNTLAFSKQHTDRYLGTTVRSRYRLDALLGRGAMGSVYRAWDLEREASCAVKLLQAESQIREAAIIRFPDEARMAARIFHPHVVEILDHGVNTDGSPFLVMELLHGRDLEAFLKVEGKLSLTQAIEIVTQIGSALHAVHQVGIVHRDIKPRNVFLVESLMQPRLVTVKIIDFGLAKQMSSPPGGRGSDGLVIGTPEYLPPEAWRGVSAEVDTRADQWALAVLTFRIISGRFPFDTELTTMLLRKEILTGAPRSIRNLEPDVPGYVAAALDRALSKDKNARFDSIHDFIRALSNLPLTTNSMNTAGTQLLIKRTGLPLPEISPSTEHEPFTEPLARQSPDLFLQAVLPATTKLTPESGSETCLLPAPITAKIYKTEPTTASRPHKMRRLPSVQIVAAALVGGAIALLLCAQVIGRTMLKVSAAMIDSVDSHSTKNKIEGPGPDRSIANKGRVTAIPPVKIDSYGSVKNREHGTKH